MPFERGQAAVVKIHSDVSQGRVEQWDSTNDLGLCGVLAPPSHVSVKELILNLIRDPSGPSQRLDQSEDVGKGGAAASVMKARRSFPEATSVTQHPSQLPSAAAAETVMSTENRLKTSLGRELKSDGIRITGQRRHDSTVLTACSRVSTVNLGIPLSRSSSALRSTRAYTSRKRLSMHAAR
ncbi:hypothetical protein EYF80_021804 [Liparis tanakae]|uniref:Uncharacterized protein n=1 Tax=Liparis tanakae TaxID=230148 RepID=A0A4Z2HT41_9TELE|nr:hypothetical protein EYF80_021804 [Liparis tanakae]